MHKPYIVYLLRCRDDTLYCGFTTRLDFRIKQHNLGKGAKYTRARLPVVCIYTEELPSLSAALKREYAIKQLSRIEKFALIKS